MTLLEELMTESRKDKRVCPQPRIWNEIWERLPNRRRMGVGWEPPAPLILAAWWETSDADKRDRFHSHLRWTAEHGAIGEIGDLIFKMQPQDWHTEQ
jgi:hypothetical protein